MDKGVKKTKAMLREIVKRAYNTGYEHALIDTQDGTLDAIDDYPNTGMLDYDMLMVEREFTLLDRFKLH